MRAGEQQRAQDEPTSPLCLQMGVGAFCDPIGFCAWGQLLKLVRPRSQRPYSGEELRRRNTRARLAPYPDCNQTLAAVCCVSYMSCHVLLHDIGADPTHVRGANVEPTADPLHTPHKILPSIAEILLGRVGPLMSSAGCREHLGDCRSSSPWGQIDLEPTVDAGGCVTHVRIASTTWPGGH